jgi:hypothetical protein
MGRYESFRLGRQAHLIWVEIVGVVGWGNGVQVYLDRISASRQFQ